MSSQEHRLFDRNHPVTRGLRSLGSLPWGRWIGSVLVLVGFAWGTFADPYPGPRVLNAGEVLEDRRLQPLKDLDGYFPFSLPESREQWETRAEEVRQRLRVSLGLWPMPTKTPLRPVLHGQVDHGDFTVEKVFFEAMPEFYVTGSLYRPKGFSGPRPGVLSPHGHWNQGRFMDSGDAGAKRERDSGAELQDDAARSPLQARNVHLARMGCVVFHYDMIGYADSVQITQALAHGFAKQRADMNSVQNWGLFSPAAEGHLQSVMGLQTWSSIRALDFLESLPDVDPDRLACTGASGGATQTFVLAALDDRIRTAYPAVMVSTAMQGGCTCENASLLRVGTGNVEIAALFAPKPLGLSTANDWTREFATKGFPDLQSVFQMYQAQDHLLLHRGEQFDHNYNLHSRLAMYRWFHKHLRLEGEPITKERPFQRLTEKELTVWTGKHMRPVEGSPSFEKKLLRTWHDDNQRVLQSSTPVWDWFRAMYGPAWDVVLGKDLVSKDKSAVDWKIRHKTEHQVSAAGDFNGLEMSGLIVDSHRGAELPTVFLYPDNWKGRTVIWLSPQGKAGLYLTGPDAGSQPSQVAAQPGVSADQTRKTWRLRPAVRELLEAGTAVVGVDLLYQGEFIAGGQPLSETPRVKNPRESAAYTFGYTPSVFVERVHDLTTLVEFIRAHERGAESVSVMALEGMGAIAAGARALNQTELDRVVLSTQGFRFGQVLDLRDPNFLPGAAKYGDLPSLIALGAPGTTWVVDEPANAFQSAIRFYTELGQAASLTLGGIASQGNQTDGADALPGVEIQAVRWLLH